jgi:hypothetical protein
MRRIFSLILLPVLSMPALAAEPPAADAPVHRAARVTWQQRFEQANLAHDGHLTKAEATGGYALIAKHFDDIDADRKGYVTENDIKAWRVMRRAAHRLTRPPVADRLKPQNTMQVSPVWVRPVTTTSTQTVAVPSDRRSTGAGASANN